MKKLCIGEWYQLQLKKPDGWFELDIGKVDNLCARIDMVGNVELKTRGEIASRT